MKFLLLLCLGGCVAVPPAVYIPASIAGGALTVTTINACQGQGKCQAIKKVLPP